MITERHVLLLLLIVLSLTIFRYFFEKAVAAFLRKLNIKQMGGKIFFSSLAMIIFGCFVLIIFQLLNRNLFLFSEFSSGLIFLGVGIGLAVLVSFASFMAVKAGFGSGYGSLVAKKRSDKVFTLLTFLFFVGPAEDLFFIGFILNLLLEKLSWAAILVYVVIFTLYHFANVLSGVENKREFFATMPLRLILAVLLGLSFYYTKSLIYGFIVHNVVDTLSYLALELASRKLTHLGQN